MKQWLVRGTRVLGDRREGGRASTARQGMRSSSWLGPTETRKLRGFPRRFMYLAPRLASPRLAWPAAPPSACAPPRAARLGSWRRRASGCRGVQTSQCRRDGPRLRYDLPLSAPATATQSNPSRHPSPSPIVMPERPASQPACRSAMRCETQKKACRSLSKLVKAWSRMQ